MDTASSNMTLKAGGYLLIEDAKGSIRSTFLEDGFFNFLNKVLRESLIIILFLFFI